MSDAGPRPAVFYRRLDAALGEGRAALPRWWPCRKGCSACCHTRVALPLIEWTMVRAAVRVLGRRARREIERAVGEFRSGRRTACPLLDSGGACRIYSARPTACRVHGQAMIVSPATGEAITMMCGPLRQRCEEWGRQTGQAIPLLDTGRILAAIADNEYGPIGYLDDFLAETLGLTTEAPTCHS